MPRIRGTHLLAASIVLWALAVWAFGTPHPAETEAAATETASPASAETTQETVTAESGSAAAVPPPAPASREAVVATAADTATAPVETPTIPTAGATGAGSAAVRPITPGASAMEGAGNEQGGVESAGASPPSHARLESGPSRLPPPPGYPALDDGAIAAQLNAARRAAWEGRFADAVAHYRAAARLRPGEHVVWGEMGNVLWTMRRWPEAAYALEGAATLLVRAGELRAASELVPAVGRIDRQAAYRIERLLWEAAQPQPG